MNNHRDVLYETARELGISEEKLNFVVNNFWKAVRFYIADPILAKGCILIEKFGRFTVEEFTISKRITQLESKSSKTTRLAYFKELYKIIT